MRRSFVRLVVNLIKALITLIIIDKFMFSAICFNLNDNVAHASENSEISVFQMSKLRLGGYGTISHTFDDRNDMAPVRDLSQSAININDYDKNSTWRMDSRLGLHADYQFNPNVECVIQSVIKDYADPSFENSIELAYLGFKPLVQLDVRAGRVAYAAFMISDIRNAEYAYLWVRPPIEFYGQLPMFSIDGGDITWNIDRGDVQWRIKSQVGRSSFALDMDTDTNDFESGNLQVLTLTRQSGPLRIRAGYSQGTSLNEIKNIEYFHTWLEEVASASRLSMPDIRAEALSLRNQLSFKDNDVIYMTLGASYDDGRLIAQAEIARTDVTRDFLPNGYTGYLSIGYRLGDFTPYATLSVIKPGNDLYESANNWNNLKGSTGDTETLHSQVIQIINSTRMEQYTHSLGLRWDFNNQAAFKLQWDNTHISSSGYGLWAWRGETFTRDSTANIYTLSMEFMF